MSEIKKIMFYAVGAMISFVLFMVFLSSNFISNFISKAFPQSGILAVLFLIIGICLFVIMVVLDVKEMRKNKGRGEEKLKNAV